MIWVRRGSLLALVLAIVPGATLFAQQDPGNDRRDPALSGRKLFLQRCSICHLPPLGLDPPDPYGPKLNGVVRNTEDEVRAREVISMGTPRMPGFRYGLTSQQINDLIAYLKTL